MSRFNSTKLISNKYPDKTAQVVHVHQILLSEEPSRMYMWTKNGLFEFGAMHASRIANIQLQLCRQDLHTQYRYQWCSWGQADARACLGVANYIMGVFNYYFTNVQDHTVVVQLVLSITVVYSIYLSVTNNCAY